MKNANYRKYNDHSHNSSTYHKKDGTPIRAKLKFEHAEIVRDYDEEGGQNSWVEFAKSKNI